MEHEMHIFISVDLTDIPQGMSDLTICVSNGDKRTYSSPRLIPLAAVDVESGYTAHIAEGTGGGLLNTHS